MTPPHHSTADVAVVIPAAGAGVRLAAGGPKALSLLGGDPLLVHAVRRVAAAASVGWLVVAAPSGYEDTVEGMLDAALAGGQEWDSAGSPCRDAGERRVDAAVVTGGAERQHSVAAALARVPSGVDIVLVHDAARALAPSALVDAVAGAVRAGADAVIPVLPVTDTVTRVDRSGVSLGHLDRTGLRAVQTPQGFRRGVLELAHAAAGDGSATDDAGLVARLGVLVQTVPGSALALKITTRYDLPLAEAALRGDLTAG